MDPRIIKYIEDMQNRGFTKEQIKNALVKGGHDSNMIGEYLDSDSNVSTKKPNYKLIVISLSILLILIGSIGTYFFKDISISSGTSEDAYVTRGWDL